MKEVLLRMQLVGPGVWSVRAQAELGAPEAKLTTGGPEPLPPKDSEGAPKICPRQLPKKKDFIFLVIKEHKNDNIQQK